MSLAREAAIAAVRDMQKTPPLPPRVWATPEEAAAHLSVSTRLLEAWRAAGTGPGFRRSGRFIRYAFAELDSWVEAQGQARP